MIKIPSIRLGRIARRFKPSDFLVLLGLAILVGISTGLLAVLFINLIQLVRAFSLQIIDWLGHSSGLLLTMAAAGLIVGYLIHRWTPEARGRGIPEVMEAVALRKGHIPARVIFTKMVATSITLGAGGSAGRQGPIVQIGAALGSTMGRIIHFSSEQRQVYRPLLMRQLPAPSLPWRSCWVKYRSDTLAPWSSVPPPRRLSVASFSAMYPLLKYPSIPFN